MTRSARPRRRWLLAAAVVVTAGCAAGAGIVSSTGLPGADADRVPRGGPVPLAGEVRLGYFPNVTHAAAIVGLEEGLFAAALGPDVTLTTHTFHAGSEAVEALLSGAIDAAYLGANPTITAHARSRGEALRVVAGAASGGAALVTRPELTTPADLAGTTLSTPGLGNTQDVALRAWLAGEGLAATLEGGGDVRIRPQAAAQILETFRAGVIDGAWVPEPWATRLVEEADGRVLVDERDLWDGGRFVTTHLVVSASFLATEPALVSALLEGHLAALDRLDDDPATIAPVVTRGIEAVAGTAPEPAIVESALGGLEFTADPYPDALRGAAEAAVTVGLLDPVDLDGLHDLSLLDRLLDDPQVSR